jgi:hypothetical protein
MEEPVILLLDFVHWHIVGQVAEKDPLLLEESQVGLEAEPVEVINDVHHSALSAAPPHIGGDD